MRFLPRLKTARVWTTRGRIHQHLPRLLTPQPSSSSSSPKEEEVRSPSSRACSRHRSRRRLFRRWRGNWTTSSTRRRCQSTMLPRLSTSTRRRSTRAPRNQIQSQMLFRSRRRRLSLIPRGKSSLRKRTLARKKKRKRKRRRYRLSTRTAKSDYRDRPSSRMPKEAVST